MKILNLSILLLLIIMIALVLNKDEASPDLASMLPDGQGLYESCLVSHPDCVDHLNIFAKAGFKLVLNYSQMYASAADQLNYARRAHALGIKIIWSMNDPVYRDGEDLRWHYTNLAATCNCTDNVGFITYIINLVKNLPATYGYYIGDEVSPFKDASPGIHWLANLVRKLDPNHPRLTVGASSNDPSQINYYYPSSMSDTADVIGADYYPYGYIIPGSSVNTPTRQVARNLASIARRDHKQYFMVLQAFAWQERLCNPWPACAPFPSYAQMRTQRDQVILNSHPRFILWYSYFELLQSDNPGKHWSDLVAAAEGM